MEKAIPVVLIEAQKMELTSRMTEFVDEYKRISESTVDHFGGKAEAMEVAKRMVSAALTELCENPAKATNPTDDEPEVWVSLNRLLKYPIRLDHYDKEHGDEKFVLGIESVLEYAECLPRMVLAAPAKEDEFDPKSRKNCPMRHENGNCTAAGGFCTAVNDCICTALHNAFNAGQHNAFDKVIHFRKEAEERSDLSLKELITHARQVAEDTSCDARSCAYQHDRLVDYLEELQRYRAIAGNPEALQLLLVKKEDV